MNTFLTQTCAALLLLGDCVWGASLSGRVRITNSSDASVTKKGNYSGVAVWLTPVDGEVIHFPAKRAVMLQKNKMFLPHVLAISAGTTVDFPNADPIFHNAFSNFNGQIFDVSLYPPGTTRSVRFARPGVVRVFCNIHPTMSAVIVVVDSPFFTTTGREGAYSFANVPAGSYELHFFHERATTDTLSKLTKSVKVAAKTDAGEVEISETGYLPMLHKNKYGNDYPAQSGDSQRYGLPQ
jgi:plastocyanin